MKPLSSATNRLFLRDTPFASLMNKRVFNVLLIATPYDAFMLEGDGRVDEQIFNEYTSLNLRYPPRFTQVTGEEDAIKLLSDRHFELIIVMPNLTNANTFGAANHIKSLYPDTPIVVLTPFSKEVSKRLANTDLSHIDYVFSWLGNAELLLAIIKLIEDRMNAPHDVSEVGVQTILLVEDSIRFYSSALPLLYHLVLQQSREFSKEALNDHLKTLRMRGRPKIMLARSYEEAMRICHDYADNMLGVISDISFTREGKKDAKAGIRLAQQLQAAHPHLPIILESSDESGKHYAEALGLPFIQKRTKSYPQDLEREVMLHFGFGDFVVTDPHTHEQLFRIRNLKELQDFLPRIPDEVLFHHLCNNHISRFLYSRAIFPPAEILRMHDAQQYRNMDEARAFILQLIAAYRQMKNGGVVAVYQKDRFDQFGQFARIGNGSMGGKGRGLAFIHNCLWREGVSTESEHFHVRLPKTVVVCTDVFDRFMAQNELYPIALSSSTDEEILQAFLQGTLDSDTLDDLLHLLSSGRSAPIAVRSSSLLEDSHYQPFAGVYSTYMVPRSHSPQETLLHVQAAIKAVYASVFYRNSKNYLSATQNLIDQEKMAIVLQEVVGTEHTDGLYYPTLSGVAQSVNYYPSGKQRAEDGVVSLAVGLGKQIVDGGKSLRFSPAYPKHQMQLSDPQTAIRETQSAFWAVDLHQAPSLPTCHDDTYLRHVSIQKFPTTDGASPYLFSTFDRANDRMLSGCFPKQGRLIASFSGLLQSSQIPLASTIRELLHMGQRNMGRPVEIELAMQMEGQCTTLYLLQIRPMVDLTEDTGSNLTLRTDGHTLLLSASQALGNGLISDVSHIVYLPSTSYSANQSLRWAQQLAEINEHFVRTKQTYLLIGAGRWGSSDASMGIPVSWSQISAAAAIVELPISSRHIEASQGSHFFHNLTSLGIPYLTLSERDLSLYNKEWFACHASSGEDIQQIALEKPLLIVVDGRRSQATIFETNTTQ